MSKVKGTDTGNTPDQLCQSLIAGDFRALSRVLSLVEADTPQGSACFDQLYSKPYGGYLIGFTGAPGAGKSTLVNCLAGQLAQAGHRVAVLAVDPSSPYTGGAILGDRVRMSSAGEDDRVYIRSVASRGVLGGLSKKTPELLVVLQGAGFDYILVETVGVGQGEVEVVKAVDCVVVTLVPGMGDGVQALKAGILEIADLFVINKADHDGADRLQVELQSVLELAPKELRRAEILRTVSTTGVGVVELLQGIQRFRRWAAERGVQARRREEFAKRMLAEALQSEVMRRISFQGAYAEELKRLTDLVVARRLSPAAAAKELAQAAGILGDK